MNERLEDVLHRSPRTGASSDFTARVMTRIAGQPAPRRFPGWKPALAAAALVVVSILSGVAFEKNREAERLEALRAEAIAIEAELEALKQQSASSSEVYLGGNGNREYVLDLRDLTAPSPEVHNVSHTY